ncbi:hypothetical protein [Acetobacterium malicum]|uniref:hypothetical protein n=1 Tax=Acetobacterium malicum TaxID=52692 RepID=UPI000427B1D0|nr:hypothetical protein [Acetobacterium dehalogenans]
MKINLRESNASLISIFENPNQIITLDANFLIPPDRSRIIKRGFDFPLFKKVWLDPIFTTFSMVAIHEAVYDELVTENLCNYVEALKSEDPPKIIIHTDSSLTDVERTLRDSIENKIYPHTNYDPNLDNKDDRGEVKSLSYIAVKGLLYFAAHDNNALQLIEKADQWSTGLDNVKAIHMYELIYFLYSNNLGDKKSLKMLYKYQYYLTSHEKQTNPEWGEFIKAMSVLYN